MKRLLLIPALISVSAAAAGQPLGPKPTLHTPDVIAPAVLPYLACLYAERGLPLLKAADGTQVPYDKSGSDCSAAREKAMVDAARLLAGKPVPGGMSESQFADQTLADMDAYVASLPMTQPGQKTGNQLAVVGIPVTIEDEVQPAYKRYDECLKTQVSNSPVTAESVLAKFRQAMTICASIRDLAVSEAAKALIAKGWDEPTRTRAATTTFAKIDESWLAMGEQYRQAMIEHVAEANRTAAAQKKH
jgi:hypothetical protein